MATKFEDVVPRKTEEEQAFYTNWEKDREKHLADWGTPADILREVEIEKQEKEEREGADGSSGYELGGGPKRRGGKAKAVEAAQAKPRHKFFKARYK